jgi:hypothetical protein
MPAKRFLRFSVLVFLISLYPLKQIANRTNDVINDAKAAYTMRNSKNCLSTLELPSDNNTMALIGEIRESLQDVVALKLDATLISGCHFLLYPIETCANWPTDTDNAQPNTRMPRGVLQDAQVQLDRCIQALSIAEYQHALFKELAREIAYGPYPTQWLRTGSTPTVPFSSYLSQQETMRQVEDLSKLFKQARMRTSVVSMAIDIWRIDAQTVPKVFATARQFLGNYSEYVGSLVGESDYCLKTKLPELSKVCRHILGDSPRPI